MIKNKAIAGIVIIPAEKGQFRMYVAWEWEDQAMRGNFAVIESPSYINKDNIADAVNNVADYGTDVTHKEEIRKLFGNLF